MTSGQDLEVALGSAEPELRRQAVGRLASYAGADRTHLLVGALGDLDWRVRKEGIAVAGRLAPSPDVLRALIGALTPGDNVGLRNAVVEALSQYGEPAVSALMQVLSDLDADGRKLAAEALALTGSARALDGLELLAEDPDPNVRAAAVEAAAGVGTASIERALQLLERCVGAPDAIVRLAALDGYNRLGGVMRFEQLEPLLSDRVLAPAARVAAGRCQDPRAALPLVQALDRARGGSWQSTLESVSELAATSPAAEAAVRRALEALSASTRKKLLSLALTPQDSDSVRRVALLVCGALGGRDAAVAAIAALEEDAFAAEAEAALLMIGADAVAPLIEVGDAGSTTLRAASLGLLARLLPQASEADTERAVEVVLNALDAAEPAVVRTALHALAEIDDQRALLPAARWLSADVPPGLRAAAAAALSACAVKFPAAAKALAIEQAQSAEGTLVAATLVAALGGEVLGDVAADLRFLAKAIDSASAAVRRAAVDALSRIPSERGVDIVVFALTDEEREVQLAAVRCLGRIRSLEGAPAGVERLLHIVEASGDDILVAAAIHSLGDTADARAYEVLRPLAKSGSPMAAVSAVEALGGLSAAGDGGRAVEALIDALAHPDAEVVKAAVRVLAQQRDPRVEVHLGACLEHAAWDIRRLVADVLGGLGGRVSVGLLKARLASEPETLVREAVQRALTLLESAAGRRTSMPPAEAGGRKAP